MRKACSYDPGLPNRKAARSDDCTLQRAFEVRVRAWQYMTASLFDTLEGIERDLYEAPNPKPTSSDKARFGKLASLYTAFSSQFAGYALDMCLRAGHSRIADPFSGMGTLGEAARSRPVNLHLGDISPFAALSSAF